jgi:Na+-transporting NADH:ubiquinone oxidoreductase subunit NqrB
LAVSFRAMAEISSLLPLRRLDPRLWQIGALTGLLAYGIGLLGFDVTAGRVALLVVTALLVQLLGTRLWKLPRFDPKSALISALSLALLLRTGSASLAAAVAAATIGSKFLLRFNGKHVFNPTNFGLVAAMLATSEAWVSPAQWGNAAFFGFLLACGGTLVVTRAARADVTAAFLFCWAGLLLARSLWLAEPIGIPLHRLESGGLLLFAFFMISDPKTTPDSRAGRILFGALVALGAAYVQFRMFRPNGPLWSLALFSLLTPGIDLVLPGRRYAWNSLSIREAIASKGENHVSLGPIVLPCRRVVPAGRPRTRLLRVLRGEGGREAL